MRFEDLDVWKRSSRLCVDIYKELAKCKDFGFKDQITRTSAWMHVVRAMQEQLPSSLSIPSNIAEGFERDTDKDGNKFFYYAKGSCGELRTQIYIGIEIGYIKKEAGLMWENETEQLSKMLFTLIKSRST